MDKDNSVSYAAFEGEMTRHEISEKRKDRIIILLIFLLFLSHIAWLWFFNQFDITDTTVTVDSQDEGRAGYIGNSGVINNGEY